MMPLEEARTEVDGWIRMKLKTGKCSELLRSEIAEGMRQCTISAFAIYDEIGQMEGSDAPRRNGTKPAAPLRYELSDIMHKHYRSSMAINLDNHWKRRDSQAQLRKIWNEFQHDGDAGKAAYDIVLGGHQARHAVSQMTGEWIVYAELAGVNCYLTLASHNEPDRDRAIKERVRSCFAEFPKLAAQLGW